MNTIINIRTEKKIKQQAESLYKRLGLNLTSAINAFLRASIRENGIPFSLVNEPNFNQATIDAIKEGRRIAKDSKVKGYKNIKDLRRALGV